LRKGFTLGFSLSVRYSFRMKTKTCYIDATDFTYHADNEPVTLFPSIESIREEKSCVGGCGVLKVTLVETERVATGSRDGEFSCRDIEQLSPEYRAHLRN